MNYFLDTEFIERGYPDSPILISLALVCEDGREFYAINSEADLTLASEWVVDNVIDKLPALTDPAYCTHSEMRDRMETFLRGDNKVQVWANFATTDFYLFYGLWGRLLDLPPNVVRYVRDLKFLADLLDLKRNAFPNKGKGRHDALVDARWNLNIWKILMNEYKGQTNAKKD